MTRNSVIAETSATESYDVFLSYSNADGDVVESVAERLRNEAGLSPFLAKWHLVPGEPWIPALEQALDNSKVIAVFFGPAGIGFWHSQEKQIAIIQGVQQHCKRIIPVLLPGARKTEIGKFLSLRVGVDLSDEGGFSQLVAGIRGVQRGSKKSRPSNLGKI